MAARYRSSRLCSCNVQSSDSHHRDWLRLWLGHSRVHTFRAACIQAAKRQWGPALTHGNELRGVNVPWPDAYDRALGIGTVAHAFRVRYVKNLPVINWIRGFHKDIGKMLFAKHPSWRYEQESRIMINYQAGQYLPFPAPALCGLIFGCRADAQFIDAVEDILSQRVAAGHPDVRTYTAHTHSTKYELVLRRRKVLRTPVVTHSH
jgi:hypothetical protein